MLFGNVGTWFNRGFCVERSRRTGFAITTDLVSNLIILLALAYLFFIVIPKITRYAFIFSGRKTPKNGALAQFISVLDGSHWQHLMDYFDLKLASFQCRGKINLGSHKIKWVDAMLWIYRSFMAIAACTWFTSICKELGRCMSVFRERIRIVVKALERRYFESLSNLRAIVALQSFSLLLIS